MDVFQKARAFIYQNARPLDFARWRYLFEGGRAEDVVSALAAYQNADGGFGHALEPDAWNPNSSPMQTWAATEILREIGLFDAAHPVVAGILRYLASGADFDGHVWHNVVKSNDDYPHAPWWTFGSASESHMSYNPTACLAGFALSCAPRGSEVHRLAERIANEAIAAYSDGELLEDMHTVSCYIRLMEYGAQAGLDVSALREKLILQVRKSVTRDTATWETGYICKPSQFFGSKESPFYEGNEEITAHECDFIRRTQLPDGSFSVNWSWGAYPEEWAVAKNWWKSDIIIKNMKFIVGIESSAT